MQVSHGISLRKKRSIKPKISAPKQISAPVRSNTPDRPTLPQIGEANLRPSPAASSTSLSVSRSRDRGGSPGGGGGGSSNTADYVKRRYSTRIPQGPLNFDNAPSLPSLPNEFLSQPPARAAGRSTSSYSAEKVAVDLKALQDPNLPADQYVARLLANASQQDIQDYQADLGKIKNHTSTELQNSVYQNRSQFIKISQEAERLKGEMRALRNLMSDLTTTLGQTNAALGINTEAVSARKFANRSSVANLEAMWSTHLQELWRRVEGSQKYLPAIPGRHVIHESGRWVELNNATFKPRHRVHLILLNDHLLVAVEKKRTDVNSPNPDPSSRSKSAAGSSVANQTPLTADRCMPLQDVEVTDLSMKAAAAALTLGLTSKDPSKNLERQPSSSAVLIRMGPDSYTYAATDADGAEKPAFLSKLRKATADLRKLLHTDIDADTALTALTSGSSGHSKNNTNRVHRNGNNPTKTYTDPHTTTATQTARNSNMLIHIDDRQHPFRHIETLVDDLSIAIALQHFGPAVDHIETLRRIASQNRTNVVIASLVDGKVATLASRLAATLVRQMCATSAFRVKTRAIVGWLVRLGFEGLASTAFLAARSDVVRIRLSQCADTGHLVTYLSQIAYITFTLVRHTVGVYQACFGQGATSAVVKWAVEVVEGFNAVLGRQMGRLERGSEERVLVVERARECARGLEEVGIDFRGLVGRGVDDGQGVGVGR